MKGKPNVIIHFIPVRRNGRTVSGRSGQCPAMTVSWRPEDVSGAEVGHQMGGSGLAVEENGELWSVAQSGCDI